MRHTILVPEETRTRAADYLASLRSGQSVAGNHLQECLSGMDIATLTTTAFLDALINTKVPQIFAESAVAGDGSDWSPTELGILGDISIAVPVTVFDNGNHNAPVPHNPPFPGTLVFTPGAILRNGKGRPPADWAEVTLPNGQLCPEGYFRLYERRLLPVFKHVNDVAKARSRQALITIPGLGCGQFSGPSPGITFPGRATTSSPDAAAPTTGSKPPPPTRWPCSPASTAVTIRIAGRTSRRIPSRPGRKSSYKKGCGL